MFRECGGSRMWLFSNISAMYACDVCLCKLMLDFIVLSHQHDTLPDHIIWPPVLALHKNPHEALNSCNYKDFDLSSVWPRPVSGWVAVCYLVPPPPPSTHTQVVVSGVDHSLWFMSARSQAQNAPYFVAKKFGCSLSFLLLTCQANIKPRIVEVPSTMLNQIKYQAPCWTRFNVCKRVAELANKWCIMRKPFFSTAGNSQ